MCQGLFAIDMFSSFEGFERSESMMMVWGRNHHSFDFLEFVEHLPVIRELPGSGILVKNTCRMMFVHVTERDDVLVLHLTKVMAALTTETDPGDVQFRAGRNGPAQTQHGGGNDHK